MSYRPPVPDPASGLDLSKIPGFDHDITNLSVTKPTASSSLSLPYSMLESWEMRERKTMGLANHIDLMSAAIFKLCKESVDPLPEELRALLIYLSRATQTLTSNSVSSMAEMLRLRREVVLGLMPSGYLLEPSLNHLRSTPITADTLFGGQISDALTTDREGQIHTSLALGNNMWQKQGTFKRPPPKSPAQGTLSKKKKSSSAQKSIIPPPAPEKQTSFPRAKGRGKGNKRNTWNYYYHYLFSILNH